jgi:hypothetical protein
MAFIGPKRSEQRRLFVSVHLNPQDPAERDVAGLKESIVNNPVFRP